jgi:hypothetical protein
MNDAAFNTVLKLAIHEDGGFREAGLVTHPSRTDDRIVCVANPEYMDIEDKTVLWVETRLIVEPGETTHGSLAIERVQRRGSERPWRSFLAESPSGALSAARLLQEETKLVAAFPSIEVAALRSVVLRMLPAVTVAMERLLSEADDAPTADFVAGDLSVVTCRSGAMVDLLVSEGMKTRRTSIPARRLRQEMIALVRNGVDRIIADLAVGAKADIRRLQPAVAERLRKERARSLEAEFGYTIAVLSRLSCRQEIDESDRRRSLILLSRALGELAWESTVAGPSGVPIEKLRGAIEYWAAQRVAGYPALEKLGNRAGARREKLGA